MFNCLTSLSDRMLNNTLILILLAIVLSRPFSIPKSYGRRKSLFMKAYLCAGNCKVSFFVPYTTYISTYTHLLQFLAIVPICHKSWRTPLVFDMLWECVITYSFFELGTNSCKIIALYNNVYSIPNLSS